MSKVRIDLSHAGMAALLKSDAVRDELKSRAEKVLAQARESAPVETGAYRDSLTIVEDTTDRAAVRVTSTAPHGFIVEAATGNLARALDAAG